MKRTMATKVLQIILGILLVVFGLNGLFQFMPMPEFSAAGGAFMGALAATGYMFPFIIVVQLLVGILLLVNRFVPLALIILAPFSLNILLFHVFLDLPSIVPALLVTVLNMYMGYAYFDAYKPLFK